jgi:hypothetical protein
MKKIIISTIVFTISILFSQICFAEFTVVPAPPHERQFNMEIAAGKTEKGSIIIKNLGNNPMTVKTYGADGTNSSQGTFALTTPSKEQKHIGTWVKFDSPTTLIPPKEAITIPFTIIVPPKTTPGNYGGGIAVEQLAGGDEIEKSGAISTSARIYVKTFVNVPGTKVHNYDWTHFDFHYGNNDHKAHFYFSFKNNGNTIIIAKPKIILSGIPPLKENVIEMSEITIQPGTVVDNIEKRWEDSPFIGIYSAKATVEFAEFDIVNNQKTNQEISSKKLTINLTPLYITVIILILIIALATYIITMYILRKKLVACCIEHKVEQEETLIEIAKKHDVSWKKLAKINKLKKPYTLKHNQTLIVPQKNNSTKK